MSLESCLVKLMTHSNIVSIHLYLQSIMLPRRFCPLICLGEARIRTVCDSLEACGVAIYGNHVDSIRN